MLILFGIGLFICLLVFMTPSGSFTVNNSDIEHKRLECRNMGYVLNRPAYRDGIEMYCSPQYEDTKFYGHQACYLGVRI